MSVATQFIKDAGHTKPIIVSFIGRDLDNNTTKAKSLSLEYNSLPGKKEPFSAISNEADGVTCTSVAMQNVIKLCDRVAPSTASVLITGESGTGKEIISKHIHTRSNRAAREMTSINCAAIPDNLLESELFGHEKGAFTGATSRRIGKFEEANGSTLLLDEISEMDLRLQAKLLRVIQEREICRVGSNKSIKIDIRIIATSNRNLLEEVKKGNFREDLYFRLNVINVALPPLRTRKEDISAFATYFIKKYSRINRIAYLPLSSLALAKLENHSFPGNIRELENILHRAVLVATENEIRPEDIILESDVSNSSQYTANISGSFVGRTMESVEKEMIINTVKHCTGNRTQAADILGISIRTLSNKLKEYAST